MEARKLDVNWLASLLAEGQGRRIEDVCIGLGSLVEEEYPFPRVAPGEEYTSHASEFAWHYADN